MRCPRCKVWSTYRSLDFYVWEAPFGRLGRGHVCAACQVELDYGTKARVYTQVKGHVDFVNPKDFYITKERGVSALIEQDIDRIEITYL